MEKQDYKKIDLPVAENPKINFYYDEYEVKTICDDITNFIMKSNIKNNKKFVKKTLFPYEVKSNNSIESHYEDIEDIINIMSRPHSKSLQTKENYQRIKNLILGYQYILKEKEINKKNITKLYNILSKDILEQEEILDGKYHRKNDVYILYSKRLDIEPDKGIAPEYLDNSIDRFIEFSTQKEEDLVCKFVQSQIMHLYFVYMHPYYDVNGRTARTISLWKEIKENAYIFSLFNRGINYSKKDYNKIIRKSIKSFDFTHFLIYILKETENELKKEHIINNVEKENKLSFKEKEALYYVLESNSNNVLEFGTFYNRLNEKRNRLITYKEMLLPLLEKNIIKKERETQKQLTNGEKNFIYSFNDDYLENHIKLEKKRKKYYVK